MSTEQSLLERLEALEKQNRRMKQIGGLAVVIAASLFLMGQTAGKRTVEANEFVLRDSNGIVRSKWFMDYDGPVLSLLDANGQDRVTVKVSAFFGPVISLRGPKGRAGAVLLSAPEDLSGSNITLVNDAGGMIALNTDNTNSSLMFSHGSKSALSLHHFFAPPGRLDALSLKMSNEGGGVDFEVSDNPSIHIRDKEGFSAAIGTTDLVTEATGETHRTSAASVVLFGKDQKVLWRAPAK